MAKTATELLNELAEKKLVPGGIVASLRAQVASAAKPVPPQTITSLLVEKGHLTAAQAHKLLGIAAGNAVPANFAAATQPIGDDLATQDALEPLEALESLDELEPLEELESVAASATSGKARAKPAAASRPAPLGADDLFGSVGADPLQSAQSTTRGLQPPQHQSPRQPHSLATTLLLAANALALLLLIAAAGFAFFPTATGDAEFQQAEGEYAAKNYAAAADQHTTFLEKFPQHPQAGLARVHQGLAKMRLAAGGGSDWAKLLPVAKNVLTEIDQQPELVEAHGELAPLLSDMAAGLAEQAASGKTAEQLAAAREALALANIGRYVPGKLRPWQRLSVAEESMAIAEHQLARNGKLEKLITAAKQAKELSAALAARDELLALYPELARDAALRDLERELAPAALAAIQKAHVPGQAQTVEGTSPTTGLGAAAGGGATFFAVAGGRMWALDAAAGTLLWHRPVGGGGSLMPVPLGAAADADIVLIDRGNSEVVRLAARSGALKWRRPISGPLVPPPLVAAQQIVVAAQDGRVIVLDANTGQTLAAIQLPLAIRAPPALAGGQILVAADRLYVFALDPADLSGKAAISLGHESQSLTIAPAALPRHAVLVENRGASSTVMHVVDSGGAQRIVQELPIAGCVAAPPAVVGTRLVIASNGGGLAVFDITQDSKAPLKQVAARAATGRSHRLATGYAAKWSGKLLVAGDGLSQCDLLASGKSLEIKPVWETFTNGVCTAVPQVIGDAVFCMRQDAAGPATIAAAVRTSSGQSLWETRLALPEAGP